MWATSVYAGERRSFDDLYGKEEKVRNMFGKMRVRYGEVGVEGRITVTLRYGLRYKCECRVT